MRTPVLRRVKLTLAKVAASVRARHADWKWRNAASPSADARCVARRLHEVGYVVLPGYYRADECAALRFEIDAALEQFRDKAQVDPEGSDHRLWALDRVSPAVRRFSEAGQLHAYGVSYCGVEIQTFLTLAARLVAKPGNQGSGGGWHRDSEYERQFKALLYVSDVDESNGPFQYLTGSHTLRSVVETTLSLGIDGKRFSASHVERLARRCPIETLVGPAGTVIVADTRGIHRGAVIQAGERYALTNYYVAPHRRQDFESHFGPLIHFPLPSL